MIQPGCPSQEIRKKVPRDRKVFHRTWVEKMTDGEVKSRLTTADVKSAYSKEQQKTSELTFSPTPADESHQLFEMGALQNDYPTWTFDWKRSWG